MTNTSQEQSPTKPPTYRKKRKNVKIWETVRKFVVIAFAMVAPEVLVLIWAHESVLSLIQISITLLRGLSDSTFTIGLATTITGLLIGLLLGPVKDRNPHRYQIADNIAVLLMGVCILYLFAIIGILIFLFSASIVLLPTEQVRHLPPDLGSICVSSLLTAALNGIFLWLTLQCRSIAGDKFFEVVERADRKDLLSFIKKVEKGEVSVSFKEEDYPAARSGWGVVTALVGMVFMAIIVGVCFPSSRQLRIFGFFVFFILSIMFSCWALAWQRRVAFQETINDGGFIYVENSRKLKAKTATGKDTYTIGYSILIPVIFPILALLVLNATWEKLLEPYHLSHYATAGLSIVLFAGVSCALCTAYRRPYKDNSLYDQAIAASQKNLEKLKSLKDLEEPLKADKNQEEPSLADRPEKQCGKLCSSLQLTNFYVFLQPLFCGQAYRAKRSNAASRRT